MSTAEIIALHRQTADALEKSTSLNDLEVAIPISHNGAFLIRWSKDRVNEVAAREHYRLAPKVPEKRKVPFSQQQASEFMQWMCQGVILTPARFYGEGILFMDGVNRGYQDFIGLTWQCRQGPGHPWRDSWNEA